MVSNIDVDAKFRTPCLVLYKKRIPCEYILFLLDSKEPKVVACSSREEVERLILEFKTPVVNKLLGKRGRVSRKQYEVEVLSNSSDGGELPFNDSMYAPGSKGKKSIKSKSSE